MKAAQRTTTVLRGNWPGVPKKPSLDGIRAIEEDYVPDTKQKHTVGESIYDPLFERIFSAPPGKIAIECDSLNRAKAFVHALTRRLKDRKEQDKYRAAMQRDKDCARVWLIEREQKGQA